jgi:hypothetical protein
VEVVLEVIEEPVKKDATSAVSKEDVDIINQFDIELKEKQARLK